MSRRIYITAALLGSAVVAGWFMAHDIKLPEPKPIDPNNMLAVQVVAPREPELAPMPRTAADRLDVGLASSYQSYTPPARPTPPPVYRAPVERPVRVEAPREDYEAQQVQRRRDSDPVYYRRYVQQNVVQPRQEPVRQYPPRYEPRYEPPRPPRQGCNAMASWCDDGRRPVEERQYYRQEADGSSRRVDPRQQRIQRIEPRQDRGEDFFE